MREANRARLAAAHQVKNPHVVVITGADILGPTFDKLRDHLQARAGEATLRLEPEQAADWWSNWEKPARLTVVIGTPMDVGNRVLRGVPAPGPECTIIALGGPRSRMWEPHIKVDSLADLTYILEALWPWPYPPKR